MSVISGGSQPDGGLQDSHEFSLICDLCELCCDRFKEHEFKTLKGTIRQRNDIRMLNIELRKALTRPNDLDLVKDIEGDGEELRGDDKNIIAILCDLLESLAYRLAPVQTGPRTSKHAHLEALINYLKDSTIKFKNVISDSGYPSALLSFPSRFDGTEAIKVVKKFNNFLDQIKAPMTDPCDLVEAPDNLLSGSERSQGDYTSRDDGLESRYQRARTSLRALFSRLSACSHREVHDLLIQLPAMEQFTSQEIYEMDIPLELLLSDCSDSSQWMEARVTCAEETSIFGSDSSLCQAISEALSYNGGLRLYVPDGLISISEQDLIIPIYDYVEPDHSQLKPSKSLWDLLHAGALSRGITVRHLQSSSNMPLVNANERRSLAIQVLLGTMLSIRYDSNMATWDSKKVFVLTDADGVHNINKPPYVSVVQSDAKGFSLDLPDPCVVRQHRQLSNPTFTKVAKILLEIGYGECLDYLDAETKEDSKALWKELKKYMDNSKSGGHANGLGSLDVLPYIAAAERCLHFNSSYRIEVSRFTRDLGVQKVNTWTIVENIVSEQIIGQLLEKSCAEPRIRSMNSVIQARSQPKNPLAVRPKTLPAPAVTLFSSSGIPKHSKLVDWARNFFSHLDQFHASFTDFVEKTGNPCSNPIKIAILDTGINKGSVGIDFDNKHMKDEWCVSFVGSCKDVHDTDGHGTHCASLLRKVAPNANIYISKVFNTDEFDIEEAKNISKAIAHARDTWKVDIISMSFGLSSITDMPARRKIKAEIEGELDRALSQLLFAAASNGGWNEQRAFPSTHPTVFCVHASDGNGNEHGINPPHDNEKNNIMTLGAGIELYDEEKEDVVYMEGTSFATAIAAGLAANILDLTSRVRGLDARSKAALKTSKGMRKLFSRMSGSDERKHRPYVVPWNYWKHEFWEVNPRGLDAIWAQLDSDFNDFDWGYENLETI